MHHSIKTMFMIHGTEPINWVYELRQRIDVYIKHHGEKIDAREITFLEEELFPVMDQFVKLCAAIDEEREQQEQAQLDYERDQLLAAVN